MNVYKIIHIYTHICMYVCIYIYIYIHYTFTIHTLYRTFVQLMRGLCTEYDKKDEENDVLYYNT